MFANRAKIVKTLEPLKLGADELKLDEVALDVAAAVLEHMVDEIEVVRSSHMSAATTPPSSQTPAVSLTSATTDPPKAPKQRPKGYWAKRIKEYEPAQIEGRSRSFPVHLLVGAEETLARMVYENESSRLFSPVKLGEIISARNFTPSRQVNPWAN